MKANKTDGTDSELPATDGTGGRKAAVDKGPAELPPGLPDDSFCERKLALGHDVRLFELFDGDRLCTTIFADYTDKTLVADNHITDPVMTAFGNNKLPTWADFEFFLEDRCIPRRRAGLREYLEAIGVGEYDPLQIILKTGGRMAEDNQHIKMVVLK
ncbi:MAG: hypothetical protein FWG48_06190 [Oscillospiraceae bacterium]|nr:hypothetical protein [Oscillospiraceae bacterium]